ncbi:unnamed protein product [Musa hybrid cultivar]
MVQVPPAELESLLRTQPDIIVAAVVPRGFFDGCPDEEASQVAVAFVVRQTHSTLKESQVMEFVSNKVAPYKKIHHSCFLCGAGTNECRR